MTSGSMFIICSCALLLAVVYATLEANGNPDSEAAKEMIREKRGLRGNRHHRHRGHRGGEDDESSDRDYNLQHGRGRRPGRRGRPGRGRRPGGRPGRRGQCRRVGSATDLSDMPQRTQRLITALVGAQNSFTVNLHREIGQPVTDVVYSPFSIHQALTMTYMGANGDTAYEMKRTLALQGLGRRTARAAKKLNEVIRQSGNATLKTANGIYVKAGLNIVDDFSDRLDVFYQANISLFDWEHPDGPEGPINEWVSAQTNNLIPDLLAPDTITDLTALILVNAIYFKATWKTPFPLHLTTQQMFRKSRTEQVPVQMMQVEGMFKVGTVPGQGARILELAYEGERFSMLVLLPDDVDNLPTLENSLSADILTSRLDTVVASTIKVFLPRFKLETSVSVKESLQNMGMTKPFMEGTADFTGIVSTGQLYISDVIHKAVVDVNEIGSEAAGATAVIVNIESASLHPPPEIRCDHPFLFIIRDNVSKANLFIGKFSGGA
ncbi:serpin B6-like [Haliotis rufescens]|uniref:serpin B6-like n=1 Tax=Haliotis rufescens TaxID=6454 RepID=UPI00201EFD72|nr:serpin B6-like [Haliotis rufescens]